MVLANVYCAYFGENEKSVSNLTHEIRTKNALYRGHSASYGPCAAGPVGVKLHLHNNSGASS